MRVNVDQAVSEILVPLPIVIQKHILVVLRGEICAAEWLQSLLSDGSITMRASPSDG